MRAKPHSKSKVKPKSGVLKAQVKGWKNFEKKTGAAVRHVKEAAHAPRSKPAPPIDLLHEGVKLPPVSSKPETGTMFKEPHLTVGQLTKALGKFNADAKVWLEGSSYWGQLTNLRTFDQGKSVLFMKRNWAMTNGEKLKEEDVLEKATDTILRQVKELDRFRDKMNRIKRLATAESLIGQIAREE